VRFQPIGCKHPAEVSPKRCNLPYTVPIGVLVRSQDFVNTKRNFEINHHSEITSLSAIDLFHGLPESRLQKIEQQSELRDVPAESVLFRTGESGQVLYLLEKGSVQTFRTSGSKKLIIADLKPPAVFGEMACVGSCIYHCCAQTTEASRVRVISRKSLDALLEEYPVVTRRLLDLVSQRFVSVLIDLDATAFQHLIPRVAKLLLQRAEEDFIRNLTHKEIAEHLRVYRESLTAALGELRKAGIIAVERKQIHILDRPRLERAARE
jgi:CRP/FNR family cyclic AMP-dependent transcriptional regulator